MQQSHQGNKNVHLEEFDIKDRNRYAEILIAEYRVENRNHGKASYKTYNLPYFYNKIQLKSYTSFIIQIGTLQLYTNQGYFIR